MRQMSMGAFQAELAKHLCVLEDKTITTIVQKVSSTRR